MAAYYEKLRRSPLIIVTVICSLSANVLANDYSGGMGEPNNPYKIATAQDLIDLGNTPEDYDKHFILTADIDLDPNLPGRKVFDTAVINSFTGVFDGNGYTISNLTIKGETFLGMFGQLYHGAEVKDLGLVDVNINGSGTNIGSLVGHSSGSIITCYCTGTVNGNNVTGGLVGDNWGSIAMSHSNCMIIGNKCVGGLVGYNNTLSIPGRCIGITTSYSTGTVNGNENVGGLVGVNNGNIMISYSTSVACGSDKIGGLVGYNNLGSIAVSYSTGEVTGDDHIGGLVGYNLIGIPEDYFINERITSCFWNIETSGQTTSDGGIGLITAKMQNINTFLNAGWDYADEILNGTCDYWKMSPNDYPKLCYLTGENPPILEGLGTAEEPYLIRNAWDLGTVWFRPLAHYRLEAPIDLSGITWSTAVVPWFEGAFDGNGYVISNLYIQGSNFLGLFGYLDNKAKVSNLGLEVTDVNGSGYSVGSIAGENYGIVTLCYSTGSIHGIGSVGGLVGTNYRNIIKSYSTSTISGYFNVGGLVGHNFLGGSIAASYSLGTVNGNENVGGLVGRNNGSISTSYSANIVGGDQRIGGLVGNNFHGSVLHCVWDIETSGLLESDGGVGLTTSEMVNPYMLGLNGFGNDPNWTLDTGIDYPHLTWEGTHGDNIPEPDINWMEGHGTVEEPYCINTSDQFILLSKASILWDRNIVLGDDINLDVNLPNMSVISQAPIQIFTGIFDGNGYTISNLTIKGKSYLGLFGRLGSSAEVKNLGVVNVNINGSGTFVGGLVGYNGGNITTSYSTGTINGNEDVGGLVGDNSGSIVMSYSTTNVVGSKNVGGLVGIIWTGLLTQCYSAGSVIGSDYVGGFIGQRSNLPSNNIIIDGCFWDIETSGCDNSAGGTGKTTAEMQIASTFLEADWDFVDEMENGTEDIWCIDEGQDYPAFGGKI